MAQKPAGLTAVVKPDYLSIVLGNGRKFQLTSGHPHFNKIKKVLQEKNYDGVEEMLDVALALSKLSQGDVTVEKGMVKFKGEVIDSSLTKRIEKLHAEGSDVTFMIKFMHNLYQNPDARARVELYDFLQRCNLPITDDGCFCAYKAVNDKFMDCHTGKIDNSPGQVVMMPRTAVDPNRRNECSNGLHFCSKGYLSSFGGQKIMMIKINPADVVAIPADYGYTKGRCCKYEVVMELSEKTPKTSAEGHIMLEEKAVLELGKERKQLIDKLLAHPVVSRNIKKKKVSKSTIMKSSLARLKTMAQKYEISTGKAVAPVMRKLFINSLGFARKAAGLTREIVASELDVAVKEVIRLEGADNPTQAQVDAYLSAIELLGGFRRTEAGAVSFPRSSGLFDVLGGKKTQEGVEA